MAVLSDAVVLAPRASEPIATFEPPVVTPFISDPAPLPIITELNLMDLINQL